MLIFLTITVLHANNSHIESFLFNIFEPLTIGIVASLNVTLECF